MDNINTIFNKHHDYYKSLGIETIQQQSGQAEQVSADYQGRVLFELLQNAFDKADKKIAIEAIGKNLYVANDGEKFTYNATHNYDGPNKQRLDFQSLCSISTSSKTDAKNIGNKGVGFKSVYSIAKDGYVDIHTRGVVLSKQKRKEAGISFRIFESFKEEEQIPANIDPSVSEFIRQKLHDVQVEREDRGIPGYYFPLLLKNTSKSVNHYFNDGYVTVIEIPYADQSLLDELFNEIESIHFNFIRLKHDKNISIRFRNENVSFVKNIGKSSEFHSAALRKNQLKELASNAGVVLDEQNKVAISYNSEGKGLFYNYLPTKQQNPFRYFDFQADFRTTVDRKTIDFDNNSKIGKYNNYLLRACIELLFTSMNLLLKPDERVDLNITNIDQATLEGIYTSFFWNKFVIEHQKDKSSYQLTRSVLKLDDGHVDQWNHNNKNHYRIAAILIARLAKEKLSWSETDVYKSFFSSIIGLVHALTEDYNRRYSRSEIFKHELAFHLKEEDVPFLPDVKITKKSEILYQDSKLSVGLDLQLPEFLPIQISRFKVEDDFLRQELGIKPYSDLNELLKYFRQVSITGEYSKDRISESQQKELLLSLFKIFKRKEPALLANRYQNFLTSKDRDYFSTPNNARFSVSTFFLKTSEGRFKPAQLCSISELDFGFLPNAEKNELDEFLIFLGVSPEKNYRVVDLPIFDKLSKGLDHCVAPLTKEFTTSLIAKQILPDIRIILPKNKQVHPALVNYNKYPFLTDITNLNIRKHLEPLKIGEYFNSYSNEFAQILLAKIKNELKNYSEDVFRLYASNVFHLFMREGEYLVMNNGRYSWTRETDFVIAKNRNGFETLKHYPIKILAYFNSADLPDNLKEKLVKLNIEEVHAIDAKDISTEFKNEVEKLIPFLIIDIGKLNISVSIKDYLKEPSTIKELQEKWHNLKIIEGSSLETEIIIDPINKRIKRDEKYQYHQNTLYLSADATPSHKAKALATHFFEISALSDRIELILFHKSIDQLFDFYDTKELELVNEFWLPDYGDKFKQFEQQILQDFDISAAIPEKWHIYNEDQKNDFLIELNQKNRLSELKSKIDAVKRMDEFENYFMNFQLRINRMHIQNKCSELLLILENRDPNSVLIDKLNHLFESLGVEEELKTIEEALQKEYPEAFKDVDFDQVNNKTKEKDLELNINRIFENASKSSKPVESVNLISEDTNSATIAKNENQKVFTTNGDNGKGQDLEVFGASGEEEVLIYFINWFLDNEEREERLRGINEVYSLLRKKLRNESHLKYRDQCIEHIDDIDELRRALIPLFYVTLHHKFAFFDLIVYYEGKATLVEVKTTKNNRKFYISKSEVNAARSEENYLLVRNTADRIELLGNPIKQFEDQFKMIKGDKLSIVPSKYEIILN